MKTETLISLLENKEYWSLKEVTNIKGLGKKLFSMNPVETDSYLLLTDVYICEDNLVAVTGVHSFDEGMNEDFKSCNFSCIAEPLIEQKIIKKILSD